MNDAAVRSSLATLVQTEISPAPAESVAGGSINRCFRYRTATGSLFVKVAKDRDPLEAESAGLHELRGVGAVRTPQVFGIASAGDRTLLALEWLDLRAATPATDATLGEQLADLHRAVKPMFGWQRSNFIGTTPQINLWSNDWLYFWRTHRFEPQFELAITNGAGAPLVERMALLNTLMDGFFVAHRPQASLLHGDLWGGNVACDSVGLPVIFDPAVYFGDRECDIAMTRLFGGFSREFYGAYAATWALPAGAEQRSELYNLYHVLNHFNLFGGNYLQQAAAMVEKLLAELGH